LLNIYLLIIFLLKWIFNWNLMRLTQFISCQVVIWLI